jgi:phage shock protein PspC (stress-responsive transcriptional regulator)
MKTGRESDALLAGVCADIAGRFGWNVWALRAVFLAFLLIKTLWAIVAYAALAVIFRLLDGSWSRRDEAPGGLESPELAGRNERIAELERKFREMEGRHSRPS